MSGRFAFSQYDAGQIYVSDHGVPVLHAEIDGPHEYTVQITTGGRVTIDKLYGPLIMWPLRITIDYNEAEWVIEREFGPVGEWREVARIPGQLESDFTTRDEETG